MRQLLAPSDEFATLMLDGDRDKDQVARMGALAVLASMNPAADGEIAAELPDLTGPVPRTEPAARERVLRWSPTRSS